MEIKLGEKIKELRKRDGRTQEDLATALGVTAQAVSRWEANGGYPDMSMIPAIANYFHITIDALFGYNNDREAKIREYVKKANQLLLEQTDDGTECIELMRKALEEFPSEPQLQSFLAHALHMKGRQEAEIPNLYLEESVSLYEHLSKQDENAIIPLLSSYFFMKQYEKAEKKALEQPRVCISKEVLLSNFCSEQNRSRYRGEAILSLLHEFRNMIEIGITENEKLKKSKEGIEIFSLVGQLYDKLLGEDYCGNFNSDLCISDLCCVRIAANIKDYPMAIAYFDSAFEQYKKHLTLWEDWRNTNVVDECFNTPLLSEVKNPSVNIVLCRPEYFKSAISSLPDDIKEQLTTNPKYAELFE